VSRRSFDEHEKEATMAKTKRMIAKRGTSKKTPRRQAMKMLRAADLSIHLSPSTKRTVRRNLPIAAAIVVGGGAIATTIAMRQQLASVARILGDASAASWKSIVKAVPVDRWLVQAGLRRKPLWQRALPALGVAGGLLASGAALFFFAPPGEGARHVLTDPMDSEDDFGAGLRPLNGVDSAIDSMTNEGAPAHGHG
jgi:hypothetical protein